MREVKRLFRNSSIYGLAPQIPKVAGVFSLPIITPYLTDIDFGVFGVIVATTGAILVLNNLGLNVVLSNMFFKSPGHYIWGWRQIYGFLIVWSVPFAALLSVVLYLLVPHEAHEHRLLIILLNVLPLILFGPTAIIGNLYYQLHERPFPIAVRALIFGLLTVILNIYFIARLELGYLGWFMSLSISTLLNQVSFWIPLNLKLKMKPIFNFKWRLIKNALKISLPTVPHYYSGYLLNSSDRVIMKLLNVSINDIGMYSAAHTVGNLVQQAGIAAGKAAGPMLYSAYRRDDEYYARFLIFVLQVTFLCGTFIISIWLREIFHLLIRNPTLQQIYPLGIVLVMAYSYRPMYLGANNKLFFLEKTKFLLKVTFIAGVSNVILNLLLVPVLGFEVAAYITFVSLMYMGYSGYFFPVFKRVSNLPYYPISWLTLTVFLTSSAVYIVELDPIIKVFISLVVGIIGIMTIIRLSNYNSGRLQ